MEKRKHAGKLPPRYKFILNPHSFLRYSKCARCNKPTFDRKFALFIHIDGWGPLVMGKICKYCAGCEIIVCQQNELDEELAPTFQKLKPEVIGNDYFVVGTVDKKTWKDSMAGSGADVVEILAHTADFKKHEFIDCDPGGWRPADADPSRYVITHTEAAARRQTPWTLGRKS